MIYHITSSLDLKANTSFLGNCSLVGMEHPYRIPRAATDILPASPNDRQLGCANDFTEQL